MEKQLFQQAILLPLQEIAFKRVVVYLWNNTLNSNWSLRYNLDLLENLVKDKVLNLLPSSLNKQMMPLVRPIGSEILNWHVFHENNFHDIREHFGLDSLKHLQWTGTGTIEYQKTIETLIDLKLFDVKKRYELACLYCLEDYIPLLSAELREKYENPLNEKFYFSVDRQLKYYWANFLKENKSKFTYNFEVRVPNQSCFHQYVFRLAAVKGNKSATRYFFKKLSNEERDVCLLLTIDSVLAECFTSSSERVFSDFSMENLSDVLCYLLSLLNSEDQMKVLKTHPCDILTCFLDWPLQGLFLKLADAVWTFLPEKKYPYLVTIVQKRIITIGYYCPKLFQEFFLRSPINFRKALVDKESRSGYFFLEFFSTQNYETIEVIFRNIDAADRAKLVFGERVFLFLCDSVFYNKWHVIKVCLQAAMLPKEDMQKLRKTFLKFIKKTHKRLGAEEITLKQKRFLHFFDEICTETAGKKKAEDETLTKVKKLCTEEKKECSSKELN